MTTPFQTLVAHVLAGDERRMWTCADRVANRNPGTRPSEWIAMARRVAAHRAFLKETS